MPENAAAEGGFDLGVSEAFGGTVGTANGPSASAVGGAFGGGTSADFGGGRDSNPASQAAAAQNAVSVASGIFGNTGVQTGLLGLAAQFAGTNVNPSLAAPAMSPGVNVDAVFGLGVPGQNPSTGGFLGGDMSPGMAPSVSTTPAAAPTAAPGPGAMVSPNAVMDRGGLQSGNFGPGLLGGTVSLADLAAGNTESVSTGRGGSITSVPGSLESMSFGVPEGMLSASTSTPSQMSTNMANDMTALAASQAIAEAQQNTSPVISLPAINVSPEQIAQDMTQPSIAQTTTTPSTYSEKGLLGKVAQDIAMGFSINPFASRDQQAAQLADKGYSQADIQGYFSRTDATMARNAAEMAASPGGGGRYEDQKKIEDQATLAGGQPQGFFVPRRSARKY
jgi:hypothetical protein